MRTRHIPTVAVLGALSSRVPLAHLPERERPVLLAAMQVVPLLGSDVGEIHLAQQPIQPATEAATEAATETKAAGLDELLQGLQLSERALGRLRG